MVSRNTLELNSKICIFTQYLLQRFLVVLILCILSKNIKTIFTYFVAFVCLFEWRGNLEETFIFKIRKQLLTKYSKWLPCKNFAQYYLQKNIIISIYVYNHCHHEKVAGSWGTPREKRIFFGRQKGIFKVYFLNQAKASPPPHSGTARKKTFFYAMCSLIQAALISH